ncbi:MAG: efflux RND transporter periplasmic adaptor subunit [Alphaproteobacteria bacterium]|nr:efflux RND transporter periplasmic adaptor subunit [Alphaproteobacteria bacterium]
MEAGAHHADADTSATDAARKSKRKYMFMGLAAAIAASGAGVYAYDALIGSHHVSTDNAYVGADIAQVTPLIGGPVKEVLVQDTHAVNAGDVLVRLDDTDAKLTLASAQARLASAQADVEKAMIDLRRREALAASGAVSGDELTSARNSLDVANASVRIALAARDQAQVDLDRTVIRAPVTGIVSRRQVQVGQRVQPGANLMVITPVQEVYVDANFKETQLARVVPGQTVKLVSDLYGEEVEYRGKVVGFSGGTGAAFAIVPAQNATGNWIKVVQRLPVRIALDPEQLKEHPLRVGLSMNVDIEVSK